jgi:hypothetical protein
MDIAAKTMEAMLSLTPLPKRLVPREKAFIVHGRNKAALADLQQILSNEKIECVVVQSLARTGQDLLEFIIGSVTALQDLYCSHPMTKEDFISLASPCDNGRARTLCLKAATLWRYSAALIVYASCSKVI